VGVAPGPLGAVGAAVGTALGAGGGVPGAPVGAAGGAGAGAPAVGAGGAGLTGAAGGGGGARHGCVDSNSFSTTAKSIPVDMCLRPWCARAVPDGGGGPAAHNTLLVVSRTVGATHRTRSYETASRLVAPSRTASTLR